MMKTFKFNEWEEWAGSTLVIKLSVCLCLPTKSKSFPVNCHDSVIAQTRKCVCETLCPKPYACP